MLESDMGSKLWLTGKREEDASLSKAWNKYGEENCPEVTVRMVSEESLFPNYFLFG